MRNTDRGIGPGSGRHDMRYILAILFVIAFIEHLSLSKNFSPALDSGFAKALITFPYLR
jgi:hypothetical protein